MTLRAIRVQIRSGPVLHAARRIIGGRERRQRSQLRIIHFRREQSCVVPCTKLIVRHPGGVGECAVHLARLHAEYSAGLRIVAGQTIRPARVVPCLSTHLSRRRLYRDLFGPARLEQIRVAVVRPPFVNDAVHAAGAVAYQQSRLEPPFDGGIGRLGGQFKGLDEYRAPRKSPISGGRILDLPVRNRDPPRLGGPIGPERHDDIVGNQPAGGDKVARIAEGARLRKQRRNLAARQVRQPQVRLRSNPRGKAVRGT